MGGFSRPFQDRLRPNKVGFWSTFVDFAIFAKSGSGVDSGPGLLASESKGSEIF